MTDNSTTKTWNCREKLKISFKFKARKVSKLLSHISTHSMDWGINPSPQKLSCQPLPQIPSFKIFWKNADYSIKGHNVKIQKFERLKYLQWGKETKKTKLVHQYSTLKKLCELSFTKLKFFQHIYTIKCRLLTPMICSFSYRYMTCLVLHEMIFALDTRTSYSLSGGNSERSW